MTIPPGVIRFILKFLFFIDFSTFEICSGLVKSCDRDSSRRPNKKKDREAELHYITRHAVWPQVADLHITSCAGEESYGPEILPACSTGPIEPIAVYRMPKFELEPKFWT